MNYIGNGVTTMFSFPFVGVVAQDIQVIFTNSSGIETVLNPSQYTIMFNPLVPGNLWSIGGSVTYPIGGSPIAVGTELTINRVVPFAQTVSINNQGAFYPQAVEQALDLLELQIQQLGTDSAYSLSVPIVDLVPPQILPVAALRANGVLAFDGVGQPIILPYNSGGGGGSGGGSPTGFPRIVTVTNTHVVGVMTSDAFGGISIYQSGSASTTIQLPSTQTGPIPVFDASNNSSTYPITVLPPAGLTIRGASSFPINFNSQSQVFYNDGNQILVTG